LGLHGLRPLRSPAPIAAEPRATLQIGVHWMLNTDKTCGDDNYVYITTIVLDTLPDCEYDAPSNHYRQARTTNRLRLRLLRIFQVQCLPSREAAMKVPHSSPLSLSSTPLISLRSSRRAAAREILSLAVAAAGPRLVCGCRARYGRGADSWPRHQLPSPAYLRPAIPGPPRGNHGEVGLFHFNFRRAL
jgi:hypothetical protein